MSDYALDGIPYRRIYVPRDVAEWVKRAKHPVEFARSKLIEREASISLAISIGTIGALKETASGNLATVGLPASPVAGDLMVCPLAGSDNVLSVQANWTLKSGGNAGTKLRRELWYRWWQSGDTAPTFTRTAGGAAIARIFIVKGVGTGSGDPFDGAPTAQADVTTTTITAPTITPGGFTDDGLFLFGYEELTNNTSGAPVQGNFGGTSPTPTQIYASRATGLGADMVSLGVSWGQMTSAGASGARTSTVAGEAAAPTNVAGVSALLLTSGEGGGGTTLHELALIGAGK